MQLIRPSASVGLTSSLTFALLILMTSACGVSNSSSGSALPPSANNLVLFTGVQEQNQQFLTSAEQQLTKTCMKAKGFEYFIDPRTQYNANQQFTGADNNPDVTKAANEGYGLASALAATSSSPTTSNAQDQPVNDAYVSHLSSSQATAYNKALSGNSSDRESLTLANGSSIGFVTGGCIGQVNNEIYGSGETAMKLAEEPNEVRNEWADRLASDSKYLQALSNWSSCMKLAGYNIKTPDDARQSLQADYRNDGDSPALETRERSTAVADAKCAISTRIVDTVKAIKVGYASHMTPDNQRLIIALAQDQDQAIARAKAQLNSGGA